jgi:CMP-N,N'-diacetyllegionaminic acid synthase
LIGRDRVLALIPARGGSKGVPRKNLRAVGGKPLLQWAIEVALESRYIDRVVVSTEDEEIAALGALMGAEVPFRRPDDAASDHATADEVIRHALAVIHPRPAIIVYLEPTTPLRLSDDIDACIDTVHHGRDFCVTLAPVRHPVEWLYYLGPENTIAPVLGPSRAARRQDVPVTHVLNGAVYAARVDAYLRSGTFLTPETAGYVMPAARSIDIDLPEDFDQAEFILARRSGLS